MTGLNKHLLKINSKRFKELNITKWQEEGITGKGVKIAVIGENEDSHHAGSWLISQVATDSEIIILNTTMGSDRISWEESFQYCLDNDIDIACVSYGIFELSNKAKELSQKLHDKGCILLCASGNDGREMRNYPIILDSWYATGAYDGYSRAGYSNWGDRLLCLGHSSYANKNRKGDYIPISHTSGTPQVISGMVAMLKEIKPNLTIEEFEIFIKENSIRISTEEWNQEEGWGLLSLPDEIPTFDNKKGDESVEEKFVDVNKKAWYYPAVKHITDNGSMEGKKGNDGKMYFEPSAPLTRAEYAQIKYNEHLEGK